MTKSSLINSCIIDQGEITEIIDLGMHPFADTFIPKERFYESEPIFPLKCGLCTNCGLVQLICSTSPKSRYDLYDYSYTSSNSEYAKLHWRNFVEETSSFYKSGSRVLEIGSNDGYLLEIYLSKGLEVLGIDSSEAMTNIANKAGIPTIHEIFSLEVAKQLANSKSDFDLIVANNVVNHSNDPLNFLKGVEYLLAPEGKFVFEVPYWLRNLETGNFDQIYHEHVSYFTISSISKIVEHTKMRILDVSINEYHGGSLRVTLTKSLKSEKKTWSELIKIEEKSNLQSLATYKEFMKVIQNKRNKTLLKIFQILENEPNAKIVLAGAAAKANTFINYYRLDSTIIHCITDSSPLKIGKYTPLARIPILPDTSVSGLEKLYVLPTAWNIGESIMKKIIELNPNAKLLTNE